MKNPQPGRRHIRELDGLRGIAVGLVMLTHFWPNTGFFQHGAAFAEIGWVGVDLFFVLSGFLITGILLETAASRDYYRRFYVRRSFRIFPLYYAFLILVFGFLAVWHEGANLERLTVEWGSPLWFFGYLANFVIAARAAMPVFAPLGPLWSLQIEEQFYLVFPFVVKRLRKRLPRFLLAVIVVAFAYRTTMLFLRPNNPWIQYVGTLARADALAFGGLVGWANKNFSNVDARRWLRLAPACLILLAAIYAAIGPAASGALTRTFGYSLNAMCFAAVVWWTVSNAGQPCTGLLRISPLQGLGKISYGVYLLQLPVQTALKIATHTPTGSMLRTPSQSILWTSATLSVAWVSWRFFETPVMRWGQATFSQKPR